ncbi:hypothetical protein EON77_21250, partial [bacterium]
MLFPRKTPVVSLVSIVSRFGFVLALALASAAPALASGPPSASPSAAQASASVTLGAEAPVDEDSPRAAMTDFFALCRAGKYADAAKYLELSKSTRDKDGAKLAQHLDAVLRRHLTLEPTSFSPHSAGDPD